MGLKQLGVANTGRELTKLGHLMGELLVGLADKPLLELGNVPDAAEDAD